VERASVHPQLDRRRCHDIDIAAAVGTIAARGSRQVFERHDDLYADGQGAGEGAIGYGNRNGDPYRRHTAAATAAAQRRT